LRKGSATGPSLGEPAAVGVRGEKGCLLISGAEGGSGGGRTPSLGKCLPWIGGRGKLPGLLLLSPQKAFPSGYGRLQGFGLDWVLLVLRRLVA